MSIHNMPEFRRETALHRFKKLLAWVGVVLACSLLTFGYGCLLAAIGGKAAAFSILTSCLLVWGLWGAWHLKSRH